MSVPMNVRSLAVACSKAARQIEECERSIAMNKAKLAEWGFPDLVAVLRQIDEEERVKPPAVMPPSAEASDHAKP